MLATLRHPCVVQCIGATDDAATPWLVLEYLERTLYEAVADATEAGIVSMLCDVLSACAYIHSRPRPIARQHALLKVAPELQWRQRRVSPAQFLWRLGAGLHAQERNPSRLEAPRARGRHTARPTALSGRRRAPPPTQVHRDLKPPNVLADLHGRCKLADFGTAAAQQGQSALQIARLAAAHAASQATAPEAHPLARGCYPWLLGCRREAAADAVVPCPTLLMALVLTIQVALEGPSSRSLTECVGSALYMAPEVEQEAPYGVAADIFSFGALAYECFYYRANGEDFYEGMNLFTGLDVFREPVTSDPQQMPERPSACEDDAIWKCICDCLTTNPAKRPAAAAAAVVMRTHLSSTGDDKWLSSGA